jgi:hypothetical protein
LQPFDGDGRACRVIAFRAQLYNGVRDQSDLSPTAGYI